MEYARGERKEEIKINDFKDCKMKGTMRKLIQLKGLRWDDAESDVESIL